MKELLRKIGVGFMLTAMVASSSLMVPLTVSAAPTTSQTSKKSSGSKKSGANTSSSKSSSTKKGASSQSSKKTGAKKSGAKKTNTKQSRKTETSADVKRQKTQIQGEINRTNKQIVENDKSLKTNLGDLEALGADMKVKEAQVADLRGKVNDLTVGITSLENEIDKNQKELDLLKEKYLQAVKQMRLKKGNVSTLAFIFSAKDFNQALRRMRYLKQFSDWRGKQSATISQKMDRLKDQRDQLSQAKDQKSRVLAQEQRAKDELAQQQSQKQVLVAQLQRNGAELRAYLSKKQAEVNALNSKISQLIAAEEAKAAEERRRKEEARKEQERIKAEKERQAQELAKAKAEKAAAEKRELADNNKANKDSQKDSNTDSKKGTTKSSKKKDNKSQNKKDTKQDPKSTAAKDNDYAAARKRKPRGDTPSTSTTTVPEKKNNEVASAASTASSTLSGFAAAKGRLPRPVAGSFKIVSPYGRHSKPGLDNVVYDNTGIDVEVSTGAAAKAVYEGVVSGVYQADGFSRVVLVRHDNYYTVYANLGSVSVSAGQHVSQGQTLGTVAADSEDHNRSVFHFEIWKERTRMNPSDWIR
jgi:septal ring factor EnvC (AmiA/AmiB activator)